MPPTSWLYQWVEEEVPVKAGDSWTPGSGSRKARAQPAYIRDPDSVSVSGTDPPTLPLCLSWGGSGDPAESTGSFC